MSRLDSFIRRLEAQREFLNHAVKLTRSVAGPFLELGLGNGRTFDHLREIAPERAIYVFERAPHPHPDCTPDDEHLIVGDLERTLPEAKAWLSHSAALIHSDIGTGDVVRNELLARWLSGILPELARLGGVIVSDQKLSDEHLAPQLPPEGIHSGRYFLYRCNK